MNSSHTEHIPRCSLIVVANDKKMISGFKDSLYSQEKVDYELIEIPNYKNDYSSIRVALHTGAKKAKNELLVFLHPDIRFTSVLSLHDIIMQVESITKFGVIGVAGSPLELINNNRVVYSSIIHGKEKNQLVY